MDNDSRPGGDGTSAPTEWPDTLAKANIEYLKKRAVSPRVAQSGALKSVSPEEAAKLFGKLELPCGGLAIPYPRSTGWGGVNSQYVRIRLDEPILDGENEQRFAVPSGRPIPVYIPWEVGDRKLDGPLLVVEGPIKALALVGVGLSAVGLGGTGTTFDKDKTGIRVLNASWDSLQIRGREVVVLYDANRNSKPTVARDEARLVQALATAGASVRVANLPPSETGEQWGPDDFLAAHGKDKLMTVIERAVPAAPDERLAEMRSRLRSEIENAEDSAAKADVRASYRWEANKLLADLPFVVAVDQGDASVMANARAVFAELGGGKREFNAAVKQVAAVVRKAGQAEELGTSKRMIRVNDRDLDEVVAEAWEVLLDAGDDEPLYNFGGAIVCVRDGAIAAVEDPHLLHRLARGASWVREGDDFVTRVKPDKDVVSIALAEPHPGVPVLESVLRAPTYFPSGLLSDNGYDAVHRVYVHIDPPVASVAPSPNEEEVAAAVDLLSRVLVDFPIVGDADKANFLAALLLPFVRPLIAGPTPLHVFAANKAGIGKTTLAAAAALIATGSEPPLRSWPKGEEEVRKQVTTALASGYPHIIIDNVPQGLVVDSGELAKALTAQVWADRLLATNRDITVPVRAVWMMTGNNIGLSSELVRRSCWIRLRTDLERPEERLPSDFTNGDLLPWVRERLVELRQAALVIIQNWVANGRPTGTATLASFHDWAATMSGLLDSAGVHGFLTNLSHILDENDGEHMIWREMASRWWERFRGERVRAHKLRDMCESERVLLGVLGDKGDHSQVSRLGRALKAKKDNRVGNFMIRSAMNADTNTLEHWLEPIADSPEDLAEEYAFGDNSQVASAGTFDGANGEVIDIMSWFVR